MSYYEKKKEARKITRKTIKELLEKDVLKEGIDIERFAYNCENTLSYGFPALFYKRIIKEMVMMGELNARIEGNLLIQL